MPRYKSPENDYQFRAEYRRSFEEWLTTSDTDFFVTLSFSQDTRLQQARPILGQWCARIDSRYLGRGWARRPSAERTFAIAVPENMSTNLHYHCLMRLPGWACDYSVADQTEELERYWYRLVPQGTCDVQPIYDRLGVARYIAKQLVRPSYAEHFLLASEFHPRRKSVNGPSVGISRGRRSGDRRR